LVRKKGTLHWALMEDRPWPTKRPIFADPTRSRDWFGYRSGRLWNA
jgi:hypothetical protein